MSVIFINQSAIHYESLGRGRPVLFLHTWVGSWRYWVPCLQAAAIAHSAYALDLFGFGESPRDESEYSIERQAGLVGSFLYEMGIDRIAMVGHGLGALVALHFANMESRRIARLLATGLPLNSVSALQALPALGSDRLLALLDGRGLHADVLLPETRDVAPSPLQITPETEQIQRALSELQSAGSPVLLINGANDPLQPQSTPDYLIGKDADVQEIILPGSGHFAMLDEADAFHRLMIDFLALDADTSPRELGLKEEWRRRVR